MRGLAVLLCACAGAPAATPSTPPDGGAVGVTAFGGVDPDLPPDDLAPLDALIGDARVIGLGESVYASGGYHAFERRMIEHVVLDGDVRAVAIETPRTAAQAVDAYVQAGGACGDATAVVQTHLASELVDDNLLALVEWLCRFDVDHPVDRVHVVGFDIEQPADDLAELGAADLGTCHEAAGPYSAADYAACVAALATLAPSVAATSFRAYQDELYFASSDPVRSFAARDAGMASVFAALDGGARTVVWAHDVHVMRAHAAATGDPVSGAVTMGAALAAGRGGYAPVALVGDDVESATEPATPVATGSFVAQLVEVGEPALIVDAAAPIAGAREALRDGRSLGDGVMTVADQFAAVVYLDQSPAMNPLF